MKGSYVRVGDANLPMTDYEVYNYEAYRRHTQEDIRCVDQAGWQLLDMDKVRLYVAKKNLERSRFSQMDEKLVYEMLSITRNGVPTLAAVMNFGFYPQGCFPQLGITAVVVPGYEIGDTEADSARFGGNCLVSLASFDYLHGLYENTGIIWIDAHPDVSTPEDGYPNAHAMVLGSLMGFGAPQLCEHMQNKTFKPEEIMYVGLQPLHDYQETFLNRAGVAYKVQDKDAVSDEAIRLFTSRFDHILVHFDIDVLDEHFFHSTYFANPELTGDGSGGGCMTIEKISRMLKLITEEADVVGFTVAEYLPFDEHKLHQMFCGISMFTE